MYTSSRPQESWSTAMNRKSTISGAVGRTASLRYRDAPTSSLDPVRQCEGSEPFSFEAEIGNSAIPYVRPDVWASRPGQGAAVLI